MLESGIQKKEELEISKQTNMRIIEELTVEKIKILAETEEKLHVLIHTE